ncbi:MAG: HutD/Ves family protein [Rhodanobacteraceae bacterium]
MSSLHAIPRAVQRDEPWANGAGNTTVILREPDAADWRVRASVAKVERVGPFSELPGTQRTLVPLDAPMTLRFPDGSERTAARFGVLRFEGAPAPTGLLPGGPTRDFNLMLRNGARGEALPHPLADSMVLPPEAGVRWLVYLDSGHAALRIDGEPRLGLSPQDAALATANSGTPGILIEGAGEIVLVKLYA